MPNLCDPGFVRAVSWQLTETNMAISVIAVFSVFTLGLLYIYVRLNDRKIMRLPSELKGIAANPFTPEAIRKAAETDPISIGDVLPPKTGRRYIVVGGVCAIWTFSVLIYSFLVLEWVPGRVDSGSPIAKRRRSQTNKDCGPSTSITP